MRAVPARGDVWIGTVPMRQIASMLFAARSRPAGPVHAAKSMEAKGLGRAEGSRLARSATREAGLTLTPSTDQAEPPVAV